MTRWTAALLLLGLTLGCDWDQAALLNGVSIRREVKQGSAFDVYLAVDGISYPAMQEAQRQGAFSGFTLAKAIPMFPATSDASWSRILHTQRFPGYEVTYYDQGQDQVMNAGLGGLVTHGSPQLRGSSEFPYYDAFDVHGQGYLDGAESYAVPDAMFASSLDQLFVVLAGRIGAQDAFLAYVLEMDVVGHDEDEAEVVKMLRTLSERIEHFRADHPEVTLRFTLFSDHGLDGVRKPQGHFVTQAEVLRSAGVEPAASFADAAARGLKLWAVGPEHTRVTYGVLATAPGLVEEVARRVSRGPCVDLVVARASRPEGAPEASEWVSLFLSGREAVRFGFDPGSDTYWLPAEGSYPELDVPLTFTGAAQWQPFSDEDLFLATVDRRYPDLFYRARTALLPISVRNTAQILYSLRDDYALKGFSVPLTEQLGAAASHGAMGGRGSEAMVLTEARELPAVLRSESVLTLFPSLKAHLQEREVAFVPGDPNASLDEARLPRAR